LDNETVLTVPQNYAEKIHTFLAKVNGECIRDGEKYSRLAELAAYRQLVMADILDLAITEWLEREIRLQKARQVMRELGEGLDEGQAPHDAARNHDVYLYGKTVS